MRNSCIGFFVGIIILTFWLIDGLIKSLTSEIPESLDHSGEFGLIRIFSKFEPIRLLILFISFLATFLNPFGWRVYLEIVNHALAPMAETIAEWVPPPLPIKLAVGVFALFLFISLVGREKKPIFELFLLAFVVLLAFIARRNLPFFYFTAAYLFLRLYGDFLTQHLKKLHAKSYVFRHTILHSVIVLLAIIFAIPRVVESIRFDTSWEKYCNSGLANYPCEVVAKYPHLSGNIFATYEWGGFLIWQLPRTKVFADGRMPAWIDESGNSAYKVYLRILQTRPGWNEQLRALNTDYLLISPGTFLDLLLQEKKNQGEYGWKKSFENEFSVLYQRTVPG